SSSVGLDGKPGFSTELVLQDRDGLHMCTNQFRIWSFLGKRNLRPLSALRDEFLVLSADLVFEWIGPRAGSYTKRLAVRGPVEQEHGPILEMYFKGTIIQLDDAIHLIQDTLDANDGVACELL